MTCSRVTLLPKFKFDQNSSQAAQFLHISLFLILNIKILASTQWRHQLYLWWRYLLLFC